MNRTAIMILFGLGAIYDGVLGLVFLISPQSMFQRFAVTPPHHYGYVQFPAALLIVFGLMFLAVARDAVGNRNLIPYGVLLKVSYCGVVFSYWFTAGISGMWKPFALIDLVFLILFSWAYLSLQQRERT